MKPLKIQAVKETTSLPPSLRLFDFKKELVCTIWADGRITPALPEDYTISEIEYFLLIAKQFFTFYNSLYEKDMEIEELNKELLCNLIPTTGRQ